MATGGQRIVFANVEKELEYNAKLYKAILNIFTECIPAVQFIDQPCINQFLRTDTMELIRARQQNDGSQSAARILLENIRKYPGFFDSILKAMDEESLKLTEFKPRFQRIKDQVDREWLQENPVNPTVPVQLRPPTQDSMETNQERTRPDSGPPPSDFVVVANPEEDTNNFSGLQRDGSREEKVTRSQEQAARTSGGDQYVDATSVSDYATTSGVTEHTYSGLGPMSNLETDAIPMAQEETGGIPQQEVGVEAEPHLGASPQRQPQQHRTSPRRREDHPSLHVAISSNPEKDFDIQTVQAELSSLVGWSNYCEEQQVIRCMRQKRDTEGTFIMWYWALAKRPTLCIIRNRRVLTFVIHKSTNQPGKFYINKRQKNCRSLRELVNYHMEHGILYTPPNEQQTTVYPLFPYTP